jgi:hypothetical protein
MAAKKKDGKVHRITVRLDGQDAEALRELCEAWHVKAPAVLRRSLRAAARIEQTAALGGEVEVKRKKRPQTKSDQTRRK